MQRAEGIFGKDDVMHMKVVCRMCERKEQTGLQLCVMVVQLCLLWNGMENRKNLFMNGR